PVGELLQERALTGAVGAVDVDAWWDRARRDRAFRLRAEARDRIGHRHRLTRVAEEGEPRSEAAEHDHADDSGRNEPGPPHTGERNAEGGSPPVGPPVSRR